MKKLELIAVLFFLLVCLAYSQPSPNSFFRFQSVNGDIKLQGLYREQKSLIGGIEEDQKSTYLIGGIKLNTLSYFWNPDLISINLDGEFNPETRNETYLIAPDRSEVRTLKKLDFRTSILRNKIISLNTFVNLNQTYFNRELLTNIKSDNRELGGMVSLNNKFLPVSATYRQSDWSQLELQTGRLFTMGQQNFLGRASKSFGSNDMNEILISRDNYKYNYDGTSEVNSLIDRVALNNSFYFDKGMRYNFNSNVSYYNQTGDNPFKKLEAIERLYFILPYNMRFTTGYNYNKLDDPLQLMSQNRVSGLLTHQLYESLTSNIFMDYSGTSQTVYDEKSMKTGFDFNYTKKIPIGSINLGYRFFMNNFDVKGESAPVKTINEEHVLSDGQMTLLNKPYVDLSSIVIKDPAGVIIYQQNFDYIITVRNNYVEVQRVFGGQIANNQLINADYVAIQPGSYSYDAVNNTFTSSILLFKRLLEFYYRGSFQDFRNLTETAFLTLNYYNQNVYGGRIDFGIAGFGVEYDRYNSNIIPYERYRYFVDLNWNFRSRLFISVNGNLMDYTYIADDVDQKYSNINGKISYNITQKTKIDLDAGYLKQEGLNIDLDLLTSKLELSTSFRQLYLKGGFEMYKRIYLNSSYFFTGTFIEMVRKF